MKPCLNNVKLFVCNAKNFGEKSKSKENRGWQRKGNGRRSEKRLLV